MWVVRDEVHRRQVGVRRETWVISEWRDGAIERLNLELFEMGPTEEQDKGMCVPPPPSPFFLEALLAIPMPGPGPQPIGPD